MQPSSLIFLVLIAIWAAYLLQHWVRRREHLATARSVDRFSDAMRVLERRSPLTEFDLSSPRPRSYAVGPTRPPRREVVVKRAPSPKTSVPTLPASAATDAAVRPTRMFRLLAGVSARRVRGLSLVASLALAVAVLPLAAFSVLPWWSVLVVVAILMVDVASLRHAAVSGRAASRAMAQDRRRAAGPDRFQARDADYFRSGSEPLFESEPGHEEPDADEEDDEDEVFGAVERAEVTERVEPLVEVDPSAWAPVPVPPPTYTLKARAADPVPVVVDTKDLTGAESWSLDGLVYDCELEELVERRSATGA